MAWNGIPRECHDVGMNGGRKETVGNGLACPYAVYNTDLTVEGEGKEERDVCKVGSTVECAEVIFWGEGGLIMVGEDVVGYLTTELDLLFWWEVHGFGW